MALGNKTFQMTKQPRLPSSNVSSNLETSQKNIPGVVIVAKHTSPTVAPTITSPLNDESAGAPTIVSPLTGASVVAIAETASEADSARDEILSQEQQRAYLDMMFKEQARENLLQIPKIKLPTTLLKTLLKAHQIQGIRCLVNQERNSSSQVNPFFKGRESKGWETIYGCSVTHCHHRTHPLPNKGALLANGKNINS